MDELLWRQGIRFKGKFLVNYSVLVNGKLKDRIFASRRRILIPFLFVVVVDALGWLASLGTNKGLLKASTLVVLC